MPTYQYRCKQCGAEFEKVQSFSDDSTPPCPSCRTRSKKNVVKVFGAVGIAFKGSGFYKNDSSESKKKVSASSDSKSSSSSDSKSSSASSATKDSGSSSSSDKSKSSASSASPAAPSASSGSTD